MSDLTSDDSTQDSTGSQPARVVSSDVTTSHNKPTQFLDAKFRQKLKKGKFREVAPIDPMLEAPVADTHAHLDMLQDPGLNLARCAVHGVRFVCAMVDLVEDAQTTYENLDSWLTRASVLVPEIERTAQPCSALPIALPLVRIAIGCHPHYAKSYTDTHEELLLAKLADPHTCALGEVGLDYHYDHSPRDVQREVFRRQIRVAHKVGVPILLHLREAHDDAYEILCEEGFPEAGCVLHCFNLGYDELERWHKKGCFAAFGGPLTFTSAPEVRDAAAQFDTSLTLTETDSPFMTPHPMRGIECGPEHTVYTAKVLAEVCNAGPGAERAAFLNSVYDNAIKLLG